VLLKDADKPVMLDEDREFLREFFKEDTRAVQEIIGRKLPWKNFHNIS
jgi:hypothetical protein